MRLVVGMGNPPMLRVIEHLLGSHSDFEIVGRANEPAGVDECIRRLAPDLIVLHQRMLERAVGETRFRAWQAARWLASMRRSSPHSKIVVVLGYDTALDGIELSADGTLHEDRLVRDLVAALRRFAAWRDGETSDERASVTAGEETELTA